MRPSIYSKKFDVSSIFIWYLTIWRILSFLIAVQPEAKSQSKYLVINLDSIKREANLGDQ